MNDELKAAGVEMVEKKKDPKPPKTPIPSPPPSPPPHKSNYRP
jgi:hypothetical protein